VHRPTRPQGLATAVAVVTTGSAIAVNLATEWKTNALAWTMVAGLCVGTGWLSLRALSKQPNDIGTSEVVSGSKTKGHAGKPRAMQTKSSGIHLEFVEERVNGERVYSRAYSYESARILADMMIRRTDPKPEEAG
jgi:hypothetical protein